MAKTSSRPTTGVPLSTPSATAARVDPPHVIPGNPDVESTGPDVCEIEPVGPPPDQLAELQNQAAQLAEHLQTRQSSVERREAEFNARMAEMDNDIRRARLWLEGRQSELEQREADFAGRDQEQELRLERIMSAEVLLNKSRDKSNSDVIHASTDLNRHQLQLDEQTLEITRRERDLEFKRQQQQQQHTDRIHALRRMEANIERQRTSLDHKMKAVRENSEAIIQRERRARRRVVELKSVVTGLEDRLQKTIAGQTSMPQPAAASVTENKEIAPHRAIEDSLRAELSQAKSELESRQQRIDKLKAELHRQRAVEREFERLKSRAAEDSRHAGNAERLVTEEQGQLDQQRAQLVQDRHALEQETAAMQHKLVQQRKQNQSDLQARQQQLERMDQQIAARSTAMQQLRESLATTQQETLENAAGDRRSLDAAFRACPSGNSYTHPGRGSRQACRSLSAGLGIARREAHRRRATLDPTGHTAWPAQEREIAIAGMG